MTTCPSAYARITAIDIFMFARSLFYLNFFVTWHMDTSCLMKLDPVACRWQGKVGLCRVFRLDIFTSPLRTLVHANAFRTGKHDVADDSQSHFSRHHFASAFLPDAVSTM